MFFFLHKKCGTLKFHLALREGAMAIDGGAAHSVVAHLRGGNLLSLNNVKICMYYLPEAKCQCTL